MEGLEFYPAGSRLRMERNRMEKVEHFFKIFLGTALIGKVKQFYQSKRPLKLRFINGFCHKKYIVFTF